MFENNLEIKTLQDQLHVHPIYESIKTLDDLKCFTEHHIYSVWDFMSIVKYIQSYLAPSNYPWLPNQYGNLRRFINEIVLEEESDSTNIDGKYLSHFEIYQIAMDEIGADTTHSRLFIDLLRNQKISEVLEIARIPQVAKNFISNTFKIIDKNKLHEVVSSFTYGRETIIPIMFRSILDKLGVNKKKCSTFYYYINRHIDMDDNKHGPLAINLLNDICVDSEIMKVEALNAAKFSLQSRLNFWNGVYETIINKNAVYK